MVFCPDSGIFNRGVIGRKVFGRGCTSINADVMVGEESLTVIGYGTDTTYGNYIDIYNLPGRVTSSTKKSYPHGIGALVAKKNYTESSPETGSPLKLYGLNVGTVTSDNKITYGNLDAYATQNLLGFGAFYKKATGWLLLNVTGVKRVGMSTVQPSLTTVPKVGDTVAVVKYSGATPENYQIVSVTVSYDEGRIILGLGDYEKDVFLSLKQKSSAIKRVTT